MRPDWEEPLFLGEVGPLMDQMLIDLCVAGMLAIVAQKINGREGQLPINMEDGFTF